MLKPILIAIVCFTSFTVGFGQADSTDINFYQLNPIFEEAEDSIMYSADYYQTYLIEFEDSLLNNIDEVIIELKVIGPEIVVYHQVFSVTALLSPSYLFGSKVKIDVGILDKVDYRLNMLLELNKVAVGEKIIKSIIQ